MHLDEIDALRRAGRAVLGDGPLALIFAEDEIEIASTLAHHRARGFDRPLLFVAPDCAIDEETAPHIRIDWRPEGFEAMRATLNAVIAMAPGAWIYWGYNAEYLHHPFCDTRSVGEMLAFHGEERRAAMLCYVVDLYAGDLARAPLGVSLADAHLDRCGYHALARPDPDNHGHPKERQLEIFGGLRWRFEEHVPPERRRIDRVALFRARRGLELRADGTFNIEEYNTYACPWHHNLTAAICSFRAAKALRGNPGSRTEVARFLWPEFVAFDWSPQQLLDLGLMEPGQWF